MMVMRSQTKWGLLFVVIGFLLILVDMSNSMVVSIYGVPSIILGLVLIVFRRREERIEEVK
jgi:membrane-bound ClpP family serine protease